MIGDHVTQRELFYDEQTAAFFALLRAKLIHRGRMGTTVIVFSRTLERFNGPGMGNRLHLPDLRTMSFFPSRLPW
jgi:hypothetical protein